MSTHRHEPRPKTGPVDGPPRRRRARVVVPVATGTGLAVALLAATVIGHAGSRAAAGTADAKSGTSGTPQQSAINTTAIVASSSPASPPAASLPGVGAALTAQIPADSRQAVVAYGDSVDSPTTTVVFYEKGADGWRQVASWRGHSGDRGWTRQHMEGDLRTPIGVFGLTDAGGLLPSPGSQLPYHQSSEFVASGLGFDGESLAKAFNYVIAINYNRVAGSSPLDSREPMGEARGGGIWLHVDHGGPTHACVSIPSAGMVMLLRELSPGEHPVIVMGDRADLASA